MIADILQDLEGGERTLSVTGKRTRSRPTTPSIRTVSDLSHRNTREQSPYHRQEVTSMPTRNFSEHEENDVVLQVEHKNDTNECFEVEYSHLSRIHKELERIDSAGTGLTEQIGTMRKILSKRCTQDELIDIHSKLSTMSNELECIDEEAQHRRRIQRVTSNKRNRNSVVPVPVNNSMRKQSDKEENMQEESNRRYPPNKAKSSAVAGSGPNDARPNGNDARITEMSRQNELTEEIETSCLESKRTRRIAMLLLLYALVASATCGWLVHQFMRIPGMIWWFCSLSTEIFGG